MQLIRKNSLVYYQFDHLAAQPNLFHAIFTRLGGTSRGAFEGLNTSFSVGDTNDCVRSNRRMIGQYLSGATPVYAHQVHGDQVSLISRESTVSTADALVTDLAGRALMIQVADCQSVILYDSRQKVVANVHSGWRGSVADIVGSTVHMMQSRLGCRADDILAGVSPSLGPCCAEFVHYRKEIPPQYWKYGNDRRYFDFWRITHDQLTAAGLRSEHIEIAGLCTRCRQDLFFSYRGAGVTGRFATVICRNKGSKGAHTE